jgi:thymidylate synthase ThyX
MLIFPPKKIRLINLTNSRLGISVKEKQLFHNFLKEKKMIDIKLLSHTDIDPIELASHAAGYCYTSIPPELGKILDVENRLFNPGHHTTIEHFYFTFAIEGVAIGNVKLGIHLTHPFYNTDERSGRFCGKMFLNPDLPGACEYIKKYWPEVSESALKEIMAYVEKGLAIYRDNIAKAGEISKKFIKEERPHADDKYIETNGPKIAQEQLRVFLPLILPTGMDHTIDLITLVSLYEAAWDPVMRDITSQMAELVLEKYPSLSFMFKPEKRNKKDWSPVFDKEETEIIYQPKLKLLNIDGANEFIVPRAEDKHPVDLLHFLPEYMNNNVGDIKTEIECSLATMGDDQRHRMVKRGLPSFTGNFYFYPIVRELSLEKMAIDFFDDWKKLRGKIPETLLYTIAPYGAMMRYKKKASFNALSHEMGKRLCWCAQSEIYHLCKILRGEIIETQGKNSPLLHLLEPSCYCLGVCGESVRYCGRNLKEKNNYFPERKV